jgi:cytochrome d ubiquinol oxidase subunit II
MLSSIGLFFVATVGLLISVFPYIVPHSLTLADTAAPNSSLQLMLIGFGLFFPPLVIYTIYAHWIFGGKIDELLEY